MPASRTTRAVEAHRLRRVREDGRPTARESGIRIPARRLRDVTGGPGDVDAAPVLPLSIGTRRPVPAVLGRDQDIATLANLLRVPARRLVTMIGPGGVGKTTLALAVAHRMRTAFPGGVVIVELAEVTDSTDVMPAIGTAIGLADTGPAALAATLTERRMLLVLDNLEHLLPSAVELATLVASCPDLVVLATSRAPLRIRAEQAVHVAPLAPEAAVRLFRDRIHAAGGVLAEGDRTARAVDRLCEHTGGLPLAVELAASVAARHGLADCLQPVPLPAAPPPHRPARQRSLAASFAWSHDLLTPPAQMLLARLSVCVGEFSLAVAERVGGTGSVLAPLAELVEHSLVSRTADLEGAARFRLLEPIGQEAVMRLTPAESRTARLALAEAMLDLGRSFIEGLHRHSRLQTLRFIAADLGNFRVAFETLADDGRHDDAAELLRILSSSARAAVCG